MSVAHDRRFAVGLFACATRRFSSDVSTIDDALPFNLNIALAEGVGLVATLAVFAWAQPVLTLVLLPLALAFRYVISGMPPHFSGRAVAWDCMQTVVRHS